MNPCENCIAFHRYPEGDVEIKGSEQTEVHACDFYPEGIPDEIWSGNAPCEFHIDD